MWLLSSDRAELHYFVSPKAVPGGYAILSHVWDRTEQTFQDTQRLHAACKTSGSNPRDHASEKVRESCMLAERHGYKWIWNDTCCIDKTSSSELSEAINSMYYYYSLADVCYAYLRDVPADATLDAAESAFRRSRWHTRGWTLQELIAPSFLVFLSSDWNVLGTKSDHASLLEDIKGVPALVLTLEQELIGISVASRMSWAANRVTTRVEDEAYSLMGIFTVNMPTLYGEGRQAFRRFQEELMRQFPDTSLFAWAGTTVYEPMPNEASMYAHPSTCLLAPAPSAFAGCHAVSFTPHQVLRKPTSNPTSILQRISSLFSRNIGTKAIALSDPLVGTLPTFSVTPHGIRAHIPVFRTGERNDALIALLFCVDEQHRHIALKLIPQYRGPNSVPQYRIDRYSRTLFFKGNLSELRFENQEPEWRSIYISPWPRPNRNMTPRINGKPRTPFRFPERVIEDLLIQRLLLDKILPGVWPYEDVTTFKFTSGTEDQPLALKLIVNIRLGKCSHPSSPEARPPLGKHWASVDIYDAHLESGRPDAHACPDDHISEWPNFTMSFVSEASASVQGCRLTLSFSPCPVNPDATFVVNRVDWHPSYSETGPSSDVGTRRVGSVEPFSYSDDSVGSVPDFQTTLDPEYWL